MFIGRSMGLIFLVASLLFAFAQEPQYGGVLRVGTNSDPATLNPYVFGNEFDRNAFRPIYDSLLDYNLTTYEVVPALIESFDISADGLQWTLNVRQNVTFHDGSAMTSADVVWAFEQAMRPEATRTAPLLSFVESVTAVDDHTVQIDLSQADQLLAHTMIDIRVTPVGTAEFNENPIGTGPFKLISWEPNRQLTYERNAAYWAEGLPYLDGIEIRTVPDSSVLVIQLINGELDLITQAPFGQIAQLVNAGMVTAVPPDGRSMGFYDIILNTQREPFNDARVRQALSYAVSRESLVRSLFGYATVQSNPIPRSSAAFADDAVSYDQRDVERAKALLAEAGYPDGVEFEMFVHRTGALEWDVGAQVIQQSAADAGFTVKIRAVDIGTWVDFVFGQKNFQAGFSAKVPKPVEYDLIAHMWAKTVGDASGYQQENPDFYELLTQARSVADQEAYTADLKELQRIAMQGLPDIVLNGRIVPAAHAQHVKGFIHHVQSSTILTRVWLDR
ncbi:MAG: ABC transporter substrate-binding protein [Trueperaceae bacterium]|nr:MAG: ABC transporter substrate-binding protein [Trueperaceae bacterium]